VLPENMKRYMGRDAQRMNILAGRIIAETVRSTLGPKGMDKMLVDDLGDVVVTNDGVTILREMSVEHPAAKMLIEVAKTQEKEVGDGTTTAVVVAGELLRKAEELLDQNVHPTIVVKGYQAAAQKAQELLKTIACEVGAQDKEILTKIAMTSITGKGAEKAKEKLAEIIVEAVSAVVDDEGKVDKDLIKIEKKSGASIDDTELIKGVLVDKERVSAQMPKKVTDAKIALLNCAIEIKETETDAEIRITDPAKLMEFIEQEEKMLKDMVAEIKASGANVLFCQKGIDDLAQHYLAKEGIVAARRVKKSDMEKLAKATGANVIAAIAALSAQDLGDAGLVEERKISGDSMIFVEECKHPKAVTMLIRGTTEHVIEEVARAVDDAVGVVGCTIEDGRIVSGGGSTEVELSMKLREYAEGISGREQLAVRAFADALEVIPRTLAENAGLDAIEILVKVRAAHASNGNKCAGLNVFTGAVEDMCENGVVEPLRVKTQAIQSAAESTEMLLRIDDVIAAE
nr:Chain A, Chaperonin [Methanococcus maripaludis]3IZI_B Chain B, Chaperonin [Methanococcus maripaludis]3IZI_C Chain C, Chaperonin [Methanococcus maripaludis]3IZI_D Chain D, Chaperonin [Methanococcus maripaludis]3IZI_E Chain E, Chaperonin [Methanococcus maripaludis]3IZI_F Chain F, Chaperonin [Methanococcus maripaludis]3IZI_G Chain G, Chaperonin [Methanococcus maripaludis]3IZI_H Chain H, Chaperonin [Methanococcus maripaludis]3IZI_I Chain I, Chaperonin [Methanococcus maripaludis]3IZI_J Chain